MRKSNKLVRQKKAAKEIAKIMYESLQQFSASEQTHRMTEIHRVGLKVAQVRHRKSSKHVSTRANSRVSPLVSALR